jgi:hypothetical protein
MREVAESVEEVIDEDELRRGELHEPMKEPGVEGVAAQAPGNGQDLELIR